MRSPTALFIWLSVITFSLYFSGHLFDLSVIVPNWKLGDLESIMRYRQFFHAATPRTYFNPVIFLGAVIPTIALILAWNINMELRPSIGITAITGIALLVFTLVYFDPKNEYLFYSGQLNGNVLETLVNQWVYGDIGRLFLSGVGFLASLNAMRTFYRRRPPFESQT